MHGAIRIMLFQVITDVFSWRKRTALLTYRWTGDVLAQPFQLVALMGIVADSTIGRVPYLLV